jgi:hypothetical protein
MAKADRNISADRVLALQCSALVGVDFAVNGVAAQSRPPQAFRLTRSATVGFLG